ncbi:MAG: type II-A CRISPR-associated protein Csn2 [Eubacteriaceae bacterium]|nr:type II-A CRISPR-associated protein Csn2 [Eubacteriaceae bacterium]
MKLYHPYLEIPIVLEENKHYQLIIENPGIYSELMVELKGQIAGEKGRFVLSRADELLSISKTTDLCIDFFDSDVNQRKIVTALHHLLAKQAVNEVWYLKTQKCLADLAAYVNALTQDFELPLSVSEHYQMEDILKLMGVTIRSHPVNLLEKIVDYLNVMGKIGKVELFVLVNLKNWLNESDFMLLYDYIEYQKIQVLFVESTQRMGECSQREKFRIIDVDGCVI